METKRTIIAVVLCLLVLVAYNTYMAKTRPAPTQEQTETAAVTTPGTQAPAQPSATPSMSQPAVVQAPAATTTPAPVGTNGTEVKQVSISNELITVNLTSWGARIESTDLSQHKDKAGPEGQPLKLLPAGSDTAGITSLLATAPKWDELYEVVEATGQRAVFAWQAPDGLRIEKTYTVEPGNYHVALSVRLVNGRALPIRDRLTVGMIQDFSSEGKQYTFFGPAYFKGKSYEETAVDDIEEGVSDTGTISWGGMMDKYFMSMLIPDAPKETAVTINTQLGLESLVRLDLASPFFELSPGGEQTFGHRIYMGPKQEAIVKTLGAKLEKAIDFGWFTVIGKPLLLFLNWLYGIVGNYGVAILILTACVKAIFWPLSAKSYKSMARMKELAPKVQKLKERYGSDREKLNAEMMHLYKTHKANPLSGCLPMVVQIPVFIALYRVLLSSIEVRHAPFAFWLHDLSAPDPYYITPVVMGLSMFLQQKMTPATGMNEGQMKMMMYGMPVVFTWMFLDFPSGLVLYWLTNNVLSIAQQAIQMRSAAKPAAA